MIVAERLSRISPFRWRLEWVLLAVAATCLVLTEQAREARQTDPYRIVHAGREARAVITAAKAEKIDLGVRRGVLLQESRTYLDLEWADERGQQRRIEGYRLDPETKSALSIDAAAGRWPAYVQILYLEREDAARPAANFAAVAEQGVTSVAFQHRCRPGRHCRVVVLAPDVLSPSEMAAQNVDYVLDRAPYAFQLSLALLFALLALRLAGVVHNRPSLE